MILGLTGGMGCGKTTAAKLFEKHGFSRVDSDAIIREQVLPAPEVTREVLGRYGARVVRPDGSIDRTILAGIIFSDDSERIWLETLTHPRLFAIQRSLTRESQGPWVFEVPLLFEVGLENWFDFTLCVACDSKLQLARLERRGIDPTLAGQRISKQLPLARKIDLSDFVLWNEGSPEFLEAQVDRLIDSLPKPRAGLPLSPTDVPPSQD